MTSSTSLLDSNLSVLAIPAYYILSMVPHAYGLTVASGGNPSKFDNRNPRNQGSKYAETLDKQTYARWERCEAAHQNSMENMPLFASAVILGNMAGLKREGLDGMNGFAGAFLAIRALYAFVYINNNTQGTSYIRSALWGTGMAMCVRVMVKAAKAMSGTTLL
ncbi:hypothetical protein W97_00466 [Coniosporium apollinis CBS 100218]|uniref:Uncharacterized protein n=1 Tax=Coniosporium apollinis (strain CBS 100218) TaxID=1168221 RepID=R7YH85_CONA1|nr:uncharacterized protein W97_00466 [Coniosporium apollinis CBS 100218]EON61253.1 hypothetical protein W97_00466 [Coniosporium apollinis CBS 100218]